MTPLLGRAIAKARELSSDQQDALASLLLDEVAAEAAWDRSLAGSQDMLALSADEAAAERSGGRRRRAATLDPTPARGVTA